MASQGTKSVAIGLLFINLILFIAIAIIAGWAVNYGIEETADEASTLSFPANLFPIYYPIGNMATGFFVIFSIIAGAVGTATSMMGIQNITSGTLSNLAPAASSSIISWALILLAMGLACKEISIGWRPTTLKTLETLTIITSGTQLLCTAIINAHLQTYDNSPPVTAYPTSVYGERV